jgi:hypothetical protein
MEKLGQLQARGSWDLIIVDTPPSRSALDFLDAPKRLGSFLDGRFIKLLTAPAKVGGRAGVKFLNLGMSMMTGTLSKVMGAGLLRDVQTFVAAMDTMFGGFRTRADATYRLLQAPGTAFLVVAAPERDALREAAYFVERLAAEDMPLAGMVLNRVHGSEADRLTAERAVAAAEALEDAVAEAEAAGEDAGSGGSDGADGPGAENPDGAGIVDLPPGKAELEAPGAERTGRAGHGGADTPADAQERTELLAAALLRLHAERMQVVARERRTRERFVSVHPEVPMVDVTALPGDVHDLAGLREIGLRLGGGQPAAA